MGDKPTKVEGFSIGVSGGYGDDGMMGGWNFKLEYKYPWKGSCDFFVGCPEFSLSCPKYISPFASLFCNEPPLKIPNFRLKTEKEMTSERIAGFINDRAGKEVIPLSDADLIEVSRGKAKDGEIKIRVVTRYFFDETPKVRLFVVKVDGTIYEEDMEENRVKVGEMSREDASALIAGLYGKKELGRNPVPSDKHIESVTKDINGEDDIDILSLMKDVPLDVYFPLFPHHDDKVRFEPYFDDPWSIPFKIKW